jgi:RNA ligase
MIVPRAVQLISGTLITMDKKPVPDIKLADVVDMGLFSQMLSLRYVKQTPHPVLPLSILNYTARAQFDRVWNDVTTLCRGLIINANDQVVARPFRKFFNAEETDISIFNGEPFTAYDKMDGSLGILYPSTKGYAIATRGSFVSKQALEGTQIWEERYADTTVNPSWTYMFEIIYPANRVVVDYGDVHDLILLGAVDTSTGSSVPLEQVRAGWRGPVAIEHTYRNLDAALLARGENGSEGLVLHFPKTDTRIKVKRSEYVRLHRLYTDVSERRVWEELSSKGSVEDWLNEVPDEIFEFVRSCVEKLNAAHAALKNELQSTYEKIIQALPDGFERRELARAVLLEAESNPLAKGVFSLYDNKDTDMFLWELLRPLEHAPFFQVSNDAD